MATPFIPSKKATGSIIEFYKQTLKMANSNWNMRDRLRDVDLAYLREGDWTEDTWKTHIAQKTRGDVTKFSNVILPLVMPKVESAVTYQQSVFLSGFPIFGAVASPEYVDVAAQLDAVVAAQQVRGNWVNQILRSIRNGFKYNYGPTEVSWDSYTSYALETAQVGSTVDRQKEVVWSGNVIRSLDPYNTFVDTRVCPTDLPRKGEFAGTTELYSRVAFMQFLASLPTRIHAREALESSLGTANTQGISGNYYIPYLNPNAVFSREENSFDSTNWNAWANLGNDGPRIKYQDTYEVTTLYGRIVPSDFKFDVPSNNTPQVWKFVIVNEQWPVYVERQTNVHQLLPILINRPVDDNLSYQTKAFASTITPFQELNSALANSLIAARRRAISDRLVYDPSRISKGQIENSSPIARIPVKPSAFGTSMSDAIYQMPFRDDQSQYAMQNIQFFGQMANDASGLNPARQGNFVKGNKTRHEFEEIMGFANGRDQTTALNLEGNFFIPMKEIIKNNILQYQGGVSLYNGETNTVITVDPVRLRKANLEFKMSDGLTPSEKLVDGESLGVALQAIVGSAPLAQGYNLAPMFSYLMKSRGANLAPFEKSPEQLAYEQAVAAWNQTIVQIADTIMKRYPDTLPEDLQKQLPPQPLPEQFGYVPGQAAKYPGSSGETVMTSYSTISDKLEQASSGQQAGAAPTNQQQEPQ